MKNLIYKYILNFGCDWSNKSDVIKKVSERGLKTLPEDIKELIKNNEKL